MKNNTVTSSQFYVSSFIASLVSLLFIDNNTSYFQIFILLLSVLLCMIITLLYNGRFSKITTIITNAYFVVMPALVLAYFVNFMSLAVKSGPYWAVLLLIALTIFICAFKGIEPLCRGGTIIAFFIALSLLFLIIGSFNNISIKEINSSAFFNLTPSLIMFYPLAVYMSNKSLIKDNSKYPLIIYSLSSFIIVAYFIFFSNSTSKDFPLFALSQKLHISVFKGGDCLLMSIITVAVIYFVVFSLSSFSTLNSQKHFSKFHFISVIISSLALLYLGTVKSVLFSQITMIIFTALIVLCALLNNISNIIKYNE